MSEPERTEPTLSRREVITAGTALFAISAIPSAVLGRSRTTATKTAGDANMSMVKTNDGTEIFYKDWGPKDAQPIVFHHGWPLSADDWDNQMLFFLAKGYRVIAHDRRGHGRSTQTATGHEMDTYAADVIALTDALDLKGAFHIGHSTGGGEVA